jgi:hypothetical protein
VENGWNPGCWMIDKSMAEKNAIRKGENEIFLQLLSCNNPYILVFPNAIIRVCQFHIIQAIGRWAEGDHKGRASEQDRRSGKRGRKKKGLPTLSKSALTEVLEAFRYAQRCRNTPDDPWPESQKTFEESLYRICQEHGDLDALKSITAYFKENWWCNEWRGWEFHSALLYVGISIN